MTVKYLVPMLGAILCTNSFADELILGAGRCWNVITL